MTERLLNKGKTQLLINLTFNLNLFKSFRLVPGAGLEPARLSPGDFKSPVSTIPPSGHKHILYLVQKVGLEPTRLSTLASKTSTYYQFRHFCILFITYTTIWCPKSDSNRHSIRKEILSLPRLPFHHSGINSIF